MNVLDYTGAGFPTQFPGLCTLPPDLPEMSTIQIPILTNINTTAAQQSLQLTKAQNPQLLSIPLLLGNPQHLLGNPQLLGNQSLFQPRTNGHQ